MEKYICFAYDIGDYYGGSENIICTGDTIKECVDSGNFNLDCDVTEIYDYKLKQITFYVNKRFDIKCNRIYKIVYDKTK